MNERTLRLRAIKQVISNTCIGSQEALLTQLQDEGFQITQATLSRDMKHLQIRKIVEKDGSYVYALPDKETTLGGEQDRIHDFMRGYISISYSLPVALVKTIPGHADSVAIALEGLELNGLMGTVAGDDTVLLVLSPGITAEAFTETLHTRIPGFEE